MGLVLLNVELYTDFKGLYCRRVSDWKTSFTFIFLAPKISLGSELFFGPDLIAPYVSPGALFVRLALDYNIITQRMAVRVNTKGSQSFTELMIQKQRHRTDQYPFNMPYCIYIIEWKLKLV